MVVANLKDADLTLKLTKEVEAARLAAAQDRLLYLRLLAGGIYDGSGRLGPPLCLVFEGWAASGQEGAT